MFNIYIIIKLLIFDNYYYSLCNLELDDSAGATIKDKSWRNER